MLKETIIYGNTTIYYKLDYADRKTLGIKVYPDKSVHVIAPVNTEIEKVREKVKSKASWIIKQQDFFLSFHPITPPRKFISGETHMYLGKQYRLKVINGEKDSVKLQGGNIIVNLKDTTDTKKIETLLKKWFKSKAEFHFAQLFDEVIPIVKSFYPNTPVLKFRWMEKRWGSCSKSGEILLNTELIKASKKCIEYVIIHELCHLAHLNHSAAFYRLLDKLAPNWRRTKEELEKMMV